MLYGFNSRPGYNFQSTTTFATLAAHPFINKSSIIRLAVLTLFLSLLGAHLSAQDRYEPGYFIDNTDQRVECSIFNKDAAKSPEEFTYMLPGESEQRKAGIKDVKEFKVGSNTFIRFTGKLDISSQDQKKLSENNDPEWETRTVFLKVIVNGKAKLYRYRSSVLELYFFSVDNSEIEQLVYKKVRITAANSGRNADVRPLGYMENMFYKSQLAARVSCGASIPASHMPSYQTSALQRHFERYNECNGEEVVREKNNNTSLHVTAGLDFGTLRLQDSADTLKLGSDNDPGFQIGLTGELTLPFNRGKWSLLVQPTYQASFGSNSYRYHQSIEMPTGIRHYFFLRKGDIFLNGFVVPDLALKYRTSTPYGSFGVDEGIALTAAFGGGLRTKRLSFEARYYFQRSYVKGFITQYSKPSFLVSYRLTKAADK